jgi:hypothetical protein
MEARLFKWVCLGLAAIAAGVVIYLLDDARRELKRTNQLVHDHVPEILANAKLASETVARLAKDLESMRDLAGLSASASASGDRALATYADSVLDFLERQPGGIGLEQLIGDKLKGVVPAADWARDARKEALWLTFRARTRAELLERLGKNKLGSPWHYAPPGGAAPVPLIDFLKQQHPESAKL